MKIKIKSLLIIIIGIIIYSCFINTVCYADFSFVFPEMEGNHEPVVIPSEPSGDNGDGYVPEQPPPEITEPAEPTFSLSVPTSITGVVYEDLDKIDIVSDGSMIGTKHLTNNFICDADEPKLEGIKVEDTTTDSSGSYSISGVGTHNISFTYGQGIDKDNYRLNKNTLKYNAQDYNMVVVGGSATSYDKNYLRKIKEIEKSFTEVYIIMDYSNSMRISSPPDRARIEILQESAINFVNALFEDAEGNLAVGYIAFGYQAVIVKKPTDVKEDIIDAISNFKVEAGVGQYSGATAPNFSSLNHKVGTNIGGAVTKARGSYLAENSNKVMVLFSDGAATAHEEVDSLYVEDTDAKIEYKLNQVATKTKEDLKAVVDSGITLINILNKTEGTERQYVEKSFKEAGAWIGNYYEVNYLNQEAVTKTLLNDTKNIIEDTESELINYEDEKIFNGSDDPERRAEVNNYYNEFYYDKLKIFEAIDKLTGTEANDIKVISEMEKYDNNFSTRKQKKIYQNFIEDGENDSNSDLGKFLKNSWMKTTPISVDLCEISYDSFGRPTEVSGYISVSVEYFTDSETGEAMAKIDGVEYKASNVSITGYAIKMDAALIKRDEFKLELDKIITGVRLTLSDGTVLYNLISDNAFETVSKNKEFKELYCKQLQKANGLISDIDMNVKRLDINEVENIPEAVYLTVDTDLLQGATLEVEYTLIVKNNSKNSTFSKGFTLVDYSDNSLLYRPENELLTEKGINSDYNWKILEQEDLHSTLKYIGDNVVKYGSGYKNCLYIDFNKNIYEKAERISSDGNVASFDTNSKYVNPVIGNNGERYVKVVLSRILSPEIVEDFSFRNQAEILKYKNNNSRRSNYIEVTPSGVTFGKYPISGNFVPTSVLGALSPSITNVNEVDTVVANKLGIIPPTGKKTFWDYLSFFKIIKR